MLCLSTLLLGCKDDDNDAIKTPQEQSDFDFLEVSFVYIPNGLGDRSYTTQIFKLAASLGDLLTWATEKTDDHKDSVSVRHLMPTSLEQAELIIKGWDKEKTRENTKRLLVLTSGVFAPAIEKCSNWRKDKNTDVVVLDVTDNNDPDLYTIGMSLYGPAWEAGYLHSFSDDPSVAILVANETDQSLKEAVDGWKDGYAAACKDSKQEPYGNIKTYVVGKYSDEARAYELADSLIRKGGIRHLVCFTGAAQIGVLRCIETLMTAEYDSYYAMATICENTYSSYWKYMIACETVKQMDQAFTKWFITWGGLESGNKDRHLVMTMDSVWNAANISIRYLNAIPRELEPSGDVTMDNIREWATAAEKKYLKK